MDQEEREIATMNAATRAKKAVRFAANYVDSQPTEIWTSGAWVPMKSEVEKRARICLNQGRHIEVKFTDAEMAHFREIGKLYIRQES
jgi:hypothetical protein